MPFLWVWAPAPQNVCARAWIYIYIYIYIYVRMNSRCKIVWAVYLRFSEGQLIQTVGVALLGSHDRFSPLSEELPESRHQLQVGGGRHVVMATELWEESDMGKKSTSPIQDSEFTSDGGGAHIYTYTTVQKFLEHPHFYSFYWNVSSSSWEELSEQYLTSIVERRPQSVISAKGGYFNF